MYSLSGQEFPKNGDFKKKLVNFEKSGEFWKMVIFLIMLQVYVYIL